MAVKGVFLIKATKDNVLQRITRIGERYPHLCGISFRQDIAVLRTTCHDMISMMEDYFEMNMAAATRYRAMLKNIARKDNQSYGFGRLCRIWHLG